MRPYIVILQEYLEHIAFVRGIGSQDVYHFGVSQGVKKNFNHFWVGNVLRWIAVMPHVKPLEPNEIYVLRGEFLRLSASSLIRNPLNACLNGRLALPLTTLCILQRMPCLKAPKYHAAESSNRAKPCNKSEA